MPYTKISDFEFDFVEFKIKKLSENKFFALSPDKTSPGKDNTYTVTITGENKDKVVCSCKSFVFRRKCKHCDAILKIYQKGGRGKKREISVKKEEFNPYSGFDKYKEAFRIQLQKPF